MFKNKKRNEEELVIKFQDWCNENSVDPCDVQDLIRKVRQNNNIKNQEEKVSKNKKYVGKCFKKTIRPYHGLFPEMNRYYKVISERANNEYRVSCLIFDEYPWYWFDEGVVHYHMGDFDFRGINTDSIMINKLEEYEEIPEEEYNLAMHNYVQELCDLKWFANHKRCGGIMPYEENWEGDSWDGN